MVIVSEDGRAHSMSTFFSTFLDRICGHVGSSLPREDGKGEGWYLVDSSLDSISWCRPSSISYMGVQRLSVFTSFKPPVSPVVPDLAFPPAGRRYCCSTALGSARVPKRMTNVFSPAGSISFVMFYTQLFALIHRFATSDLACFRTVVCPVRVLFLGHVEGRRV